MHADNGGVDHLDSASWAECVYDAARDTSPLAAGEPVVASGVWAKMPPADHARVDAIEDTSVVRPRNATRLVRQHRPYGSPFVVGEFVANDSSPSLGV